MGLLDGLNLPTLGDQGGASPKPERGASRKARRAARTKAGQVFRERVRQRDGYRCRHCGRRVMRTADHWLPNAAHVHHLRGRHVAPQDKYNVDAAVTLCGQCHRAAHGQR